VGATSGSARRSSQLLLFVSESSRSRPPAETRLFSPALTRHAEFRFGIGGEAGPGDWLATRQAAPVGTGSQPLERGSAETDGFFAEGASGSREIAVMVGDGKIGFVGARDDLRVLDGSAEAFQRGAEMTLEEMARTVGCQVVAGLLSRVPRCQPSEKRKGARWPDAGHRPYWPNPAREECSGAG
jgi:hypothetical protein